MSRVRFTQSPKPVQSIGANSRFAAARRDKESGPARRILPRVEAPPAKPTPRQVDQIMIEMNAARAAGDVVTSAKLLNELRALAVRPGLSEEPPESIDLAGK